MLIFKNGSIEIWTVNESWGTDYYGNPIACPSIGLAYEIAALGTR
jgi:hypothetical protein